MPRTLFKASIGLIGLLAAASALLAQSDGDLSRIEQIAPGAADSPEDLGIIADRPFGVPIPQPDCFGQEECPSLATDPRARQDSQDAASAEPGGFEPVPSAPPPGDTVVVREDGVFIVTDDDGPGASPQAQEPPEGLPKNQPSGPSEEEPGIRLEFPPKKRVPH